MTTTPNFLIRHRRKIISAILLLVAAIIALWWWRAREQPRNVEKTVQVIVASAAGGETKTQERVITVPRGFSVPDRPLTEEELQAIEDEREVEVCGKGWMKQKDVTDFFDKDPGVREGMTAVSMELRRSADPMGRMTGISMAIRAACEQANRLALFPDEAMQRLRYKPITSCEDGRTPLSTLVSELTSIATATNDPGIYALAVRSCQQTGMNCPAITVDRWVELDRGNVTAMLAAAPRSTSTTLNEPAPQSAMDTVLREATFVASRSFDGGRVMGTNAFQAMAPADQVMAAGTLMTYFGDDEFSTSGGLRLVRYCRAEPRDATRTAGCGRTADLWLLREKPSLLSIAWAKGMSANGDWSPEKFAVSDSLFKQYMQHFQQDVGPTPGISCDSAQKSTDYMRRMFADGELKIALEEMRKKGEVVMELKDLAAMK
jgi:hypothetical protein